MLLWFLVTFIAVVLGLLLARHAANFLAAKGVPIAAGDPVKTEVPA